MHDARFLEEVGVADAAGESVRGGKGGMVARAAELETGVFGETGGVVVSRGFGVAESFEEGIGGEDASNDFVRDVVVRGRGTASGSRCGWWRLNGGIFLGVGC